MSEQDTNQAPLLLQKHAGRIAVVTLNRPQAFNAVTAEMAQALEDAVRCIEADGDIWVAVLTGAGDKCFCAGADIRELATSRADTLRTAQGGFAGFVSAPRNKPWIAALNGVALGGGCEIALAMRHGGRIRACAHRTARSAARTDRRRRRPVPPAARDTTQHRVGADCHGAAAGSHGCLALAGAVRSAQRGDLIVLQSALPRLFCAGADIAQFVSGSAALARQEQGLVALIDAMAESEAPTLAVARGRAAGAGAILLALADVVLAADDLQIAAPEFIFGMYPIVVEAVLQSRLWPALVQRLCTGVGGIDAAQGQALGLVTEVLPVDGFEAAASVREAHYEERFAGLQALRGSRRVSAGTASMRQQLRAVGPLMIANFEAPGVHGRIQDYVHGLRKR